MPVSVVILAAGQGKRMHSDLPKVLQPLAGRPLLAHVLAAARALDPAAIHVVYGHGGDAVKAAFADQPDVRWVLQSQQLGTGHAVLQALPSIPDSHQVLVLLGDVPLVSPRTLQRLVNDSADGEARAADRARRQPDRLRPRDSRRERRGRANRRGQGRDRRRARVNEVNTGLMASPPDCSGAGSRARNDNAQGEYYLTDAIARAVAGRHAGPVAVIERPTEVLGVNDRAQLAIAERDAAAQASRRR